MKNRKRADQHKAQREQRLQRGRGGAATEGGPIATEAEIRQMAEHFNARLGELAEEKGAPCLPALPPRPVFPPCLPALPSRPAFSPCLPALPPRPASPPCLPVCRPTRVTTTSLCAILLHSSLNPTHRCARLARPPALTRHHRLHAREQN